MNNESSRDGDFGHRSHGYTFVNSCICQCQIHNAEVACSVTLEQYEREAASYITDT